MITGDDGAPGVGGDMDDDAELLLLSCWERGEDRFLIHEGEGLRGVVGESEVTGDELYQGHALTISPGLDRIASRKESALTRHQLGFFYGWMIPCCDLSS